MKRNHKAILAALLGSAAVLGGANIAVYSDHHATERIEEDSELWNCHTMGNKLCGPADSKSEIARRAELARGMLQLKNGQYNFYITGQPAGSGIYPLDSVERVTAELGEDSPYVHDELIEGCEGDWNDPFCDIVRHYQQIRIDLQASR